MKFILGYKEVFDTVKKALQNEWNNQEKGLQETFSSTSVWILLTLRRFPKSIQQMKLEKFYKGHIKVLRRLSK